MEVSVQVTLIRDECEVTKVASIKVPVGNMPSDLSTIAPRMFSQLFAAIDASEGIDDDDDEEGDE